MNQTESHQGLYRPEFEHDSCGTGFITNINGHKSYQIIDDALTMLENMEKEIKNSFINIIVHGYMLLLLLILLILSDYSIYYITISETFYSRNDINTLGYIRTERNRKVKVSKNVILDIHDIYYLKLIFYPRLENLKFYIYKYFVFDVKLLIFII